jgi:hypothetical protein
MREAHGIPSSGSVDPGDLHLSVPVCGRLWLNLDVQPPAALIKPIATQGNDAIFNPCHRETMAPIIIN